jgi:hypothetical protein
MNFISDLLEVVDGYYALFNLIMVPVVLVVLVSYLPIPTALGVYALMRMCLTSAANNKADMLWWSDPKNTPSSSPEKIRDEITTARKQRNRDVFTALFLVTLYVIMLIVMANVFLHIHTACRDYSGEVPYLTLPNIMSHMPAICGEG